MDHSLQELGCTFIEDEPSLQIGCHTMLRTGGAGAHTWPVTHGRGSGPPDAAHRLAGPVPDQWGGRERGDPRSGCQGAV